MRKRERVHNDYHVHMMSIVQNVSGRGFVDMTATYYCQRIAVKSSTKKKKYFQDRTRVSWIMSLHQAVKT